MSEQETQSIQQKIYEITIDQSELEILRHVHSSFERLRNNPNPNKRVRVRDVDIVLAYETANHYFSISLAEEKLMFMAESGNIYVITIIGLKDYLAHNVDFRYLLAPFDTQYGDITVDQVLAIYARCREEYERLKGKGKVVYLVSSALNLMGE